MIAWRVRPLDVDTRLGGQQPGVDIRSLRPEARRSEGEAGADRVRHERFAEAAAHCVLGSPSGAVRGHQHLRCHLRQVVEHPRDQRLEQRTAQVEAAQQGVERLTEIGRASCRERVCLGV